MPPMWKVKRELMRVRDRSLRRFQRVVEVGKRKRHDRTWLSSLTETSGLVPPGRRVAVFVLFQPKGIAASSVFTCSHLAANGYAPLVVSNAPLSQKDRERLAPHAWRIVERPNFGYDFGAYQDAVRLIWHEGHDLDALVLLNDSTWFPLRATDDTLARLEAMDAEFAGLAYKQEPYAKSHAWHVESHFLMFKRKALSSPAFRAFWSGYAMTSDRAATIIQGEKKISQAMIAAGFHPQAIMCHSTFLHWFGGLPAAKQRDILAAGTYHIARPRDQIDQLLHDYADTRSWQMRAFMHVNDMLASLEFFTTTTFVATGLVDLGQPFLKKSKEPRERVFRFGADRLHLARRKALELNDLGRIAPFDPAVETELRRAVETGRAQGPVPARLAVPRPA
jgi:hypothetical protein